MTKAQRQKREYDLEAAEDSRGSLCGMMQCGSRCEPRINTLQGLIALILSPPRPGENRPLTPVRKEGSR